MAVKFQSEEWAKEMTNTLQANEAVTGAAKGQNTSVQFVTNEVPGGTENKTFFKIVEGVPEVGVGDIDSPEATITQTYETAVAIDKGELNSQNAFMQGKIKIAGNMMKMMQLQPFVQAVGAATKDVIREY
ncbi:MAG: SCP2 sterol-binding domain-containing protein [Actinomycetota bacterium]